MKLSSRLLAIANYIDCKDKIVDVGCDHGYLDIYLALNKKNKMIIASDISPLVIKSTRENISKYNLDNKIKTYCTSGIENIHEEYNTIVLSGLGAHTIINILKKDSKAQKLIIQSNNHWDLIRENLIKLNYSLRKEKLIYENKKLYSIMVFTKEEGKLTKKEKLVGLYNQDNVDEYKIWININTNILKSIPRKHLFKRLKYQKQIYYLNKYLSKENGFIC
ncbi:MAG: SAM-dependent methyltransferase [Bacilli bacterium]|nr:SAM-dependent methyltransferase [Bacilli bacterium]